MRTDICYVPATEALQLFRDKKPSPVELFEAQIARAGRIEPIINAFSHTYYEEALDQARAAEQRYLKGKSGGTLDGLAVAIK